MKLVLQLFLGPWQSCVKPQQMFADNFYSGKKLHHTVSYLMKKFHLNTVIQQLTTNDKRLQISTASRVQPAFITLSVSYHCFYPAAQTTKYFPRSSFKHSTKPALDTILKKAEQKTCMKWNSVTFLLAIVSQTCAIHSHFECWKAWTLCSMNCLYRLTPLTLWCLFMAYVPLGNDRSFPDLYRRHAMVSKQKPHFH